MVVVALLDNMHYLLYHLSLAMYPRILTTFDEDLKPLVTTVRVGNAVDVVGQAGQSATFNTIFADPTALRGARLITQLLFI
jgi:26S proteasome regulatory subunit N1